MNLSYCHLWPEKIKIILLAVIFGFDIAVIAFHHTIRVILIFLAMPSVAMRFQRKS